MFNVNDMPEDVAWVWAIQMVDRPVGFDTLTEMKAIIKANPKYFPWETKYASIPQSVHDAYWEEKNIGVRKLWDETFTHTPEDGGFIGIIPTIMKMAEAPPIPQQERSWTELFNTLLKEEQDKRESEKATLKKEKSLWDKHYKPYGLEYRK
jgi:hypothetical protein